MIKMTTMYSIRITSFPRKTYARSEALTAYRFGNATGGLRRMSII